jgi:hypothetical protein
MKRFIFTYLEIGQSTIWKSKEEALQHITEQTLKYPNLYYSELKFLKSGAMFNERFAWSEVII